MTLKREEYLRKRSYAVNSTIKYNGDIGNRIPPAYVKPRAWKVLKTNGAISMVQATNYKYAVGIGIRTGDEFPRTGVSFFPDFSSALKEYERLTANVDI